VGCRNGPGIEAWLQKQTLQQTSIVQSTLNILEAHQKKSVAKRAIRLGSTRRMLKLNFVVSMTLDINLLRSPFGPHSEFPPKDSATIQVSRLSHAGQ
jgi:hypothetical protein